MKWVSSVLCLAAAFILGKASISAEEKPAKALEVGQGLKLTGKLESGRTSAIYHVRLVEKGTYVIDMASASVRALTPLLRLLDKAGNPVAADSNDGGPKASLIFQAPLTATYLIVATSVAAAGVGPFRLAVTRDDAKHLDALEARVRFLDATGKHAAALSAARELTKRRERQQGATHWQTVNARWQVRKLEKVAALPADSKAELTEADKLDKRVEQLYREGNYGAARPYLEKALAIRRRILGEEHPDTAASYHNLSYNLIAQGKYAAAAPLLERALAIREKTLGQEHPDTAQSCNNLAANLNMQAKYAEASPLYARSLAIRRKILGEEHPDTAIGYANVAHNLDTQGKYAEAASLFEKALAIHRKSLGEEHPHTSASYYNLANNLNARGKYAEAASLLERAAAIYRRSAGEEHRETAAVYSALALNLNAQHKYAQAEPLFEKTLAIYRKTAGVQHPFTATACNNLAHNLGAQGKYAEAARLYEEALAIYRKVPGQEHLVARTCNNMAVNLNAQGNYPAATPLFEKALASRRTLLGEDHPQTAGSYHNLAVNLTFQRKLAEAVPLFEKALALRGKVLGEEHLDTAATCNMFAINLNAQGKYDAARAMWSRAARSFAAARLNLSASGLERAAFGDRSPLPFLAANLARSGNPVDAWQRFEESLARGTWDDLATRLRRTPDDRARQSSLANQLARLNQLVEKALSPGVNPDVKKRLPDWLTEQRKVQDELAEFTQALEKRYGPVAGQVFDRATIQKAIPPDAALIAWVDIESRPRAADPNGEHWGVVLRARGLPVWVRLPGSGAKGAWTKDDTELPGKLRLALRQNKADWQALAAALHHQRLEPLARHLQATDGLPAVKRLIVLPAAALAGVPLESCAADYTVSYALSGTMFAHLKQRPKLESQALLVLADPIFEKGERPIPAAIIRGTEDDWPDLPGTRFEADALRKLFSPKTTMLLTDSKASEQTLDAFARKNELGRYRYVHLATHAEADEQFPLRSAVILARDHLPDPFKQWEAGLPAYDGRLTAEEILSNWNLKADLVTLSACETALGKYERGEGFVGFAQALILSGSRSVCLSLWKVDDTATALLMERFYQNLRTRDEKRLTKAEALAEAKSWLRNLTQEEAAKRTAALTSGVSRAAGRKRLPPLTAPPASTPQRGEARPYAHPYYWAAFVLIGGD